MITRTFARHAEPARLPRPLPLLVFLALPVLVLAQTRYTITDLGNLGGSVITPNAINATGTIVGSETVTIQGRTLPFIYANGIMTRLAAVGTSNDLNDAKGINAAGTVVGTTLLLSAGDQHGWVISGGVLTDLGTGTSANAINDAGTIAGTTSGGTAGYTLSGNVRTVLTNTLGGTINTVSGINASGAIVGTVDLPSGNRRAFRHAGGVMTDLGALGSTGRNSYAYGINNAGTVVGAANDAANFQLRAVVYSGGVVTDIDPTGGTNTNIGSTALGINSAGVVVGTYSAGTGAKAFTYTAAGGLVDLNATGVVVNLAAAGFRVLSSAYAVNDAGQIVGNGQLTNGRFAAFRLDVSTIPAAPTVAVGPQSQVVPPGSSVVFSVTATSTALTYQWRLNTTPIAGATDSTFSIASATTANAGSYSVVVTNAGGTATSTPANLTVTSGVAGRLINLSILTSLAGGSDSFTMGYVVGGAGTSGTKPLVIRAVGPSLTPLGVGGALADPKLEFFAGPTKSGENDNWGGAAALVTAMNAVGAFAFTGPASLDAAVLANAVAGDNSVKVSPVGNLSGAVIAEIYEAPPAGGFTAATPRLVNVSVLKNIGTGLTAGFVVGGNASKTVLVRAIGPTLAGFGVGGTVADPQLALFNAASVKIAENDNWGGSAALTAVFDSVSAFRLAPAASRDAALVVTLAPGNYTVQVSGVGGTTGTALVEVYEVP